MRLYEKGNFQFSLFELFGSVVVMASLTTLFLPDQHNAVSLAVCMYLAANLSILGIVWARVVRRNSPDKKFNSALVVAGWLFVMSFEGASVLFFLWAMGVKFYEIPEELRACEILAPMAIPAYFVWRFAEER